MVVKNRNACTILWTLMILLFLLRSCQGEFDTYDKAGDVLIHKDRHKNMLMKREGIHQTADDPGSWTTYYYAKERTWIIPYKFHKSITDSTMKTNIYKAIQELHRESCLSFLGRRKHHCYYVQFRAVRDNETCTAHFGQRLLSNQPNLILLNSSCKDIASILHLIMTTLGYCPVMLQMPDRDEYVSTRKENVELGSETAFGMVPSINSFNSSNDFGSILHASSPNFSHDDVMGDAITKKDSSPIVKHQQNELSPSDIEQLNTLYSCPELTNSSCTDRLNLRACQIRRNIGLCQVTPRKMKKKCQLTCGFCKCRDAKNCLSARKSGTCYMRRRILQMQTECPVTCGYCGEGCVDRIEKCSFHLVRDGKCEGHQDRLSKVCRRTCGYCL